MIKALKLMNNRKLNNHVLPVSLELTAL